jgi:hypothetical protein
MVCNSLNHTRKDSKLTMIPMSGLRRFVCAGVKRNSPASRRDAWDSSDRLPESVDALMVVADVVVVLVVVP